MLSPYFFYKVFNISRTFYLHSVEDSTSAGDEMNAVLVPFQWVTNIMLVLSLRFRTDKTILLSLRFRAKNICWPKGSGGCHGF
ncbi:hypothetical protein ACIQXF_09220 [Lysinibacillus sp. NPDC097231]|uniref:hypothetical protein n=1 Tax=Lysinibacillus sp. NPDC097231 TaxID=3364142 RepID=UPI0037F7E7AB